MTDKTEMPEDCAHDYLDFDYEAQGAAWMPLLKSHRDAIMAEHKAVVVENRTLRNIAVSRDEENEKLRALVGVMKEALHAADAMLLYGGKLNSTARDTITKALAAAEKAGV